MPIKGGLMAPHPPLIIPEVGRGQERKIQATIDGYYKGAERLASWEPETVVVISPHTVMYADYFHISPGKGFRTVRRSSGQYKDKIRQRACGGVGILCRKGRNSRGNHGREGQAA